MNNIVLLNADGTKMLTGYDAKNALAMIESYNYDEAAFNSDDEFIFDEDDEEDAA
jgi:hypothetical protein